MLEFDDDGNRVSDGQIEVIFLNIDLHHKQTQESMYCVVKRNDSLDPEVNKRTPWKVFDVLTAEQIKRRFTNYKLPKEYTLPPSSKGGLLRELERVPTAEALINQVDDIVDSTDFLEMKSRGTKRQKCIYGNCKCNAFRTGKVVRSLEDWYDLRSKSNDA